MTSSLLLILPAMLATTLTVAAMPLVAQHRRRARLAAKLAWIADLQLPAGTFARLGGLPAGGKNHMSTSEPLVVRILRAHVRTLEAALQQGELQAGARVRDGAAEELSAYQRQVDATIRAMARQVEGDGSAARILARTAAAVERLTAPDLFVRPRLSRAGSVALLTRPTASNHLHYVASWSGPTQPPAHAAPVPAEETDYETAELEAEKPPGAEQDLVPNSVPAKPELVLPVPPMDQPDRGRGERRRFRGRVA